MCAHRGERCASTEPAQEREREETLRERERVDSCLNSRKNFHSCHTLISNRCFSFFLSLVRSLASAQLFAGNTCLCIFYFQCILLLSLFASLPLPLYQHNCINSSQALSIDTCLMDAMNVYTSRRRRRVFSWHTVVSY